MARTPPEAGAAPPVLDDVDQRILAEVCRDARLSVRAIARKVGMSPGAAAERILRLEQRGVILGYQAVVDPEKLGYAMAAIVGLQTLHGPEMGQTIGDLMAIPEVRAVHVVTGQWDLVIELMVRDHRHLERVLIGSIWGLAAFRRSETLVVLRSHQRRPGWSPAVDLDGNGTSSV